MTTLLFIVLIMLLLGALPFWPFNRGWGYWPGAIIGLVLILVAIFMLTGR